MRNFTDDFLKLKDKRFVLYGAGVSGSKVFEYLKRLGFSDDSIVCFVDRDLSKQGKRLCDRDIKPPAYLLEHPEFVIVICSYYHQSIMSDLRALGASHQVYTDMRFYFVPLYDAPHEEYSLSDLLSNYDDDPYTKDILEVCGYFRQPGNCTIQPIESAVHYTGSENYWCDDGMPTLDYNELTILDGGAYTGDTFKLLYEKYGQKIKRYYALEPDRKTADKLRQNLDSVKNVNIKILEYGLSDTAGQAFFDSNPLLSHIVADGGGGGVAVRLMPIDDLNIQVEGKLCIKIDIEGFELKALKGASETISRYLPDMAVCVYHLADDIYKIPHFIKSLNKKYRCVIRGGASMVCFAHYEE